MVLVFVVRGGGLHHSNAFNDCLLSGKHWLASEPLYSGKRGFVYSPLVAAFFAPFSVLPVAAASILWRLLSAFIFVAAVCKWLKSALHRDISIRHFGVVFL